MGRRLVSGVVTVLGPSPTGRTVSGRGAAPSQGDSTLLRAIVGSEQFPVRLSDRERLDVGRPVRGVGAQSAGRSSTREWARLVNPAARAGDEPEPAAAAACSAYLRATTTESPMAPDSARMS